LDGPDGDLTRGLRELLSTKAWFVRKSRSELFALHVRPDGIDQWLGGAIYNAEPDQGALASGPLRSGRASRCSAGAMHRCPPKVTSLWISCGSSSRGWTSSSAARTCGPGATHRLRSVLVFPARRLPVPRARREARARRRDVPRPGPLYPPHANPIAGSPTCNTVPSAHFEDTAPSPRQPLLSLRTIPSGT